MQSDELNTIYDRVGAANLGTLVANFYRRVSADPVLKPMYPEEDLEGAETRLREFLVFRLGGPPQYLENRGHPRLRMRHAPFPIDQEARDHWFSCMDAALSESDLDESAAQLLREFFAATATFLINRN